MASNILLTYNAEGTLRKRPLPSFIKKLWFILSDIPSQEYICWADNGQVICVPNVTSFSNNILPKYFKHSNWQSFVRQLNLYGFRKVYQLNLAYEEDSTTKRTVWQFKHECFQKDNPEKLTEIKRRASKPSSVTPLQQPIQPIQSSANTTTYVQKLPLTNDTTANNNNNTQSSSFESMSQVATQQMVTQLSKRLEYVERKRKELLEQTLQIHQIQTSQQNAIRVLMEFVVQILEKYPDAESDKIRFQNLMNKTMEITPFIQETPSPPPTTRTHSSPPLTRPSPHVSHPPPYQQQQQQQKQESLPSISSLMNSDTIGDLPPLRKRPNNNRQD